MTSVLSGHNLSATLLFLFIGMPSFVSAADKVSKPEATVPTVSYRSVFRETTLGVESDKVDWRKANDAVGKFTRGHVDILKQEEMEGDVIDKKAMDDKKSTDSKAIPAKPTLQIAPAPHKH